MMITLELFFQGGKTWVCPWNKEEDGTTEEQEVPCGRYYSVPPGLLQHLKTHASYQAKKPKGGHFTIAHCGPGEPISEYPGQFFQ